MGLKSTHCLFASEKCMIYDLSGRACSYFSQILNFRRRLLQKGKREKFCMVGRQSLKNLRFPFSAGVWKWQPADTRTRKIHRNKFICLHITKKKQYNSYFKKSTYNWFWWQCQRGWMLVAGDLSDWTSIVRPKACSMTNVGEATVSERETMSRSVFFFSPTT